jgi:hypothetical protein
MTKARTKQSMVQARLPLVFCQGEVTSIRRVCKYHIQALTEGSSATHLNVMIDNME